MQRELVDVAQLDPRRARAHRGCGAPTSPAPRSKSQHCIRTHHELYPPFQGLTPSGWEQGQMAAGIGSPLHFHRVCSSAPESVPARSAERKPTTLQYAFRAGAQGFRLENLGLLALCQCGTADE